MSKRASTKKSTGSTKKAQSIQCCVWDFTSYDTEIDANKIKQFLYKICKKFCFQLEKGEEKGKDHWQGRISLKMKKRKSQVIDEFSEFFEKFHISTTSNANKNNNFYVMKEETRIEGPFMDTDIKIPRDIQEIDKLYPWQQSMLEKLSTYAPRKIDVIIDVPGNKGKSIFSRWMMCFKNAQLLPPANDYKDLMRMCMCVGPKDIYLIDMPKAMDKNKLAPMYTAIESIKTGYAYDDRYEFKQLIFDPPRICVFTNVKPNLDHLTEDKWNLWSIDPKTLELIEYKDPLVVDKSITDKRVSQETILDIEILPESEIEYFDDHSGFSEPDKSETEKKEKKSSKQLVSPTSKRVLSPTKKKKVKKLSFDDTPQKPKKKTHFR